MFAADKKIKKDMILQSTNASRKAGGCGKCYVSKHFERQQQLGGESYNCNSRQCNITRLKQCMSQNETMHKLVSKITCKCQFKQNNIMQHYKVCCSKQFPALFSLPQACPCCMLCTICVKNAARDELLSLRPRSYGMSLVHFYVSKLAGAQINSSDLGHH